MRTVSPGMPWHSPYKSVVYPYSLRQPSPDPEYQYWTENTTIQKQSLRLRTRAVSNYLSKTISAMRHFAQVGFFERGTVLPTPVPIRTVSPRTSEQLLEASTSCCRTCAELSVSSVLEPLAGRLRGWSTCQRTCPLSCSFPPHPDPRLLFKKMYGRFI